MVAVQSARQNARNIRLGKLGVEEHIQNCLATIDRENPNIFALRHVDKRFSLEKARVYSVEAQNARFRGRLHGLTFCAKDHIDVSGLPRSEGTLLGADDIASSSARAIQYLEAEGAICLGKSNMAQYGKSYFTDNSDFGRTSNPHDTSYSSGGSSGGDAAAVAAGFVDFALGADSGGSIRVPANYCGLFGMYPTRGVVSDAGLSCETHTTRRLFRSLGPLARHIDDLELVFRVIRKHDALDPASCPWPVALAAQHGATQNGATQNGATQNGANRKFGFFSTMNGVQCSAEIQTSLAAAKKNFESCGYQSVEITPQLFDATYEPFIILAGQASLLVEDLVAQTSGTPREPKKESPSMKHFRTRVATELPPLTVESLLHCWYRIDALRNQVHEVFDSLDFVLMPVAACGPSPHDLAQYIIDGQTYESQQVFQFSTCINTLGIPAVAFPTQMNSAGLPLGLQITGPRYSDLYLIEVLREAGYRNALR